MSFVTINILKVHSTYLANGILCFSYTSLSHILQFQQGTNVTHSILWGDSPSTPEITQASSATHVYTLEGDYTITVNSSNQVSNVSVLNLLNSYGILLLQDLSWVCVLAVRYYHENSHIASKLITKNGCFYTIFDRLIDKPLLRSRNWNASRQQFPLFKTIWHRTFCDPVPSTSSRLLSQIVPSTKYRINGLSTSKAIVPLWTVLIYK